MKEECGRDLPRGGGAAGPARLPELATIALRHRVALVAGMVETLDEPGRAYNTLVTFGPDGGRLASYRKMHLFDAQGFWESAFIKPGPSTEPVVFEAGGAVFGLMTCYDLRFPGLARRYDAGGGWRPKRRLVLLKAIVAGADPERRSLIGFCDC